jgi:hypothetical protein
MSCETVLLCDTVRHGCSLVRHGRGGCDTVPPPFPLRLTHGQACVAVAVTGFPRGHPSPSICNCVLRGNWVGVPQVGTVRASAGSTAGRGQRCALHLDWWTSSSPKLQRHSARSGAAGKAHATPHAGMSAGLRWKCHQFGARIAWGRAVGLACRARGGPPTAATRSHSVASGSFPSPSVQSALWFWCPASTGPTRPVAVTWCATLGRNQAQTGRARRDTELNSTQLHSTPLRHAAHFWPMATGRLPLLPTCRLPLGAFLGTLRAAGRSNLAGAAAACCAAQGLPCALAS